MRAHQVIRGKPAQCRSTVGAPKKRQRILSVHRSGWSRNAGLQQWYGGSEALEWAGDTVAIAQAAHRDVAVFPLAKSARLVVSSVELADRQRHRAPAGLNRMAPG